jgi:hypothetical protein
MSVQQKEHPNNKKAQKNSKFAPFIIVLPSLGPASMRAASLWAEKQSCEEAFLSFPFPFPNSKKYESDKIKTWTPRQCSDGGLPSPCSQKYQK